MGIALLLVVAGALPQKEYPVRVALEGGWNSTALNLSVVAAAAAGSCPKDLGPYATELLILVGRLEEENLDFGNGLEDVRLVGAVSGTKSAPGDPIGLHKTSAVLRAAVPHVRMGSWTVATLGPGNSEDGVINKAFRATRELSALSYGATAVSLLQSDSPQFTRVVPGVKIQAAALGAVMKFFAWRRVAIFHQDTEWGRDLAVPLAEQTLGGSSSTGLELMRISAVSVRSSVQHMKENLLSLLEVDMSMVYLHATEEVLPIVAEAAIAVADEATCGLHCFVWVFGPHISTTGVSVLPLRQRRVFQRAIGIRFHGMVKAGDEDLLDAAAVRGAKALGFDTTCASSDLLAGTRRTNFEVFAYDSVSVFTEALSDVIEELGGARKMDEALCDAAQPISVSNACSFDSSAGVGPLSCSCPSLYPQSHSINASVAESVTGQCVESGTDAWLGTLCSDTMDVRDERPLSFASSLTSAARKFHHSGLSGRIHFTPDGDRIADFSLTNVAGDGKSEIPVGSLLIVDDAVHDTMNGSTRAGLSNSSLFSVSITSEIHFMNGLVYNPHSPNKDPTSALQVPRDYVAGLRPIDVVVAPVDSTWVYERNGEFGGVCVVIFETIAETLRLNYTFRRPSNVTTYDGLVQYVAHGHADIAIGDISLTASRSLLTPFSQPFNIAGLRALVRSQEDEETDLFGFTQPFQEDLWEALFAAIVGMALVVFVLESKWAIPTTLSYITCGRCAADGHFHTADGNIEDEDEEEDEDDKDGEGGGEEEEEGEEGEEGEMQGFGGSGRRGLREGGEEGKYDSGERKDGRRARRAKKMRERKKQKMTILGMEVSKGMGELGTATYAVLWTVFSPEEQFKHLSTRVVITVWLFVMLVATASFTASLASFLTVHHSQTVVNSIDDVDSSTKIALLSGSFEEHYVLENLEIPPSVIVPTSTVDEILDLVADGTVDVGIAAGPLLEEALAHAKPHCGLIIVGSEAAKTPWAFPMRPNLYFANDFNHELIKISGPGSIVEREIAEHIPKHGCLDVNDNSNELSDLRLGFSSFRGLFIVLGVVVVLAILGRCLEAAFGGQRHTLLSQGRPRKASRVRSQRRESLIKRPIVSVEMGDTRRRYSPKTTTGPEVSKSPGSQRSSSFVVLDNPIH